MDSMDGAPKKKKMEELVAEAGECGRFQFLLVPLSLSYAPLAVWSMLFMVFGALEPDWWSLTRDRLMGLSSGSWENVSPLAHSLNHVNHDRHQPGNDTSDGSSYLVDAAGSMLGREVVVGFEELQRLGMLDNASYKACLQTNGGPDVIVFAPGLQTVVVKFQLVCDRAWIVPLAISVQMIGVLVGAFIGGQLGDSIGRKKTVVIMTVSHAVFNLVTAFAITWQMFAVCRSLVGLTIGGLLSCCWPYPTEFVGVKWRPLLGSVPMWGVGSVSFSLLVWVLPHWSHVHLVTAACTALTLPVWCFLPESVRWLSTRGHVKEAHKVLRKMAKWNGRPPPSMPVMEDSGRKESERKYTYFHLFSTWPVAKISVLNGFMWFSASLAYYGISFGTKNLSGNFNLNFFLMSIVEIPPTLCVYLALRCFGRRWTCSGSFGLAAATCWSAVLVSRLMSTEEAVLYINGLCLAAKVGLNLGWSAMSVFAAELYPTVVRNIGFGFLNTTARVSGILAPYVLSLSEPYAFYAIVGAFITLNAIAPLLLRETGGQPLHDLLPEKSNRKQSCVNGEEFVVLSSSS